MTLDELIERVERATGPDRDIDVGISDHIGFYVIPFTGADPQAWLTRISGKWVPCDREGRGYLSSSDRYCPRYTESLDAIVGLIEAQRPGWDYTLEHTNEGLTIRAQIGPEKENAIAFGDTDALALCAAFLKALRASQQRTK